MLRLENISKSFGRVQALNSVNLTVAQGQVLGLIGDNGAGKSTLVKIISGLLRPDSGQIFWRGQPVEIGSVKRARALGIEAVHEGGLTIGILSVSDNIFLTRELKKSFGPFKIIDRRRQDQVAAAMTAELGLAIDSPQQEIRFCSGGERQGAAIVRALQHQSSLVILDEPTSGLAPGAVHKIFDFVRKLKEKNLSCIFVTPDIYRAAEVADSFAIMVNGALLETIDNGPNLNLDEVEERLNPAFYGGGPN